MAVLDAIKRMTIFANSKTTTSSSTSSNATQKKTKQGFLEQISIRAKGFFCKKVIDAKSKSKQKNAKTKAINTQ